MFICFSKKRGGIWIYYKNFLPSKVTGVCPLEECIAFGLIKSNKLWSFIEIYRPRSQSEQDFATFSDNFEMNFNLASMEILFLLAVLSDFNAKLS